MVIFLWSARFEDWTSRADIKRSTTIDKAWIVIFEFKLIPLLKDEKDDSEFMSDLFKKTILYRQQFEELIGRHTQNWELERIANMDMLLMQMALAEILYIPSVPVKASLNEYIDISKEYSTPNSKVFVNGVLDKIIAELKRDNKISKTGRGLKEN